MARQDGPDKIVRMARAAFQRNANLNLVVSTSDIDIAARTKVTNVPIGACEAANEGLVLARFVQALAKRQARLDIGLAFEAANDNAPRILH
jgi:hypothetical protein